MSQNLFEPSKLIRVRAYAPPLDTGLQIIYQDEHLIAIDKPAGLLSVPGRGVDLQDCALHRVKRRFPSALLVHRLDEATSGLLLFALSPAVQKSLGAAFAARQVEKTYLAWVHGKQMPIQGVIDAPISVDWPHRPMRKIDQVAGQSAITHFKILSKDEHSAHILCRLEPKTGRTHQLRVHMQHLGHPIVGDQMYGLPQDLSPRLMLHASELKFAHPIDKGDSILLQSAPPF